MKKKMIYVFGALLLSPVAWAAEYSLKFTDAGFEPASISAPAGKEVTLKITRTTDATCAKEILIQAKKVKAPLPLNQEITLTLGKLNKGKVRFACGMDMISGVILVE